MDQDEIRLESRALAVADVVGAISSHRPYRRDMGIEAALKEIDKNKGVFYDTEVARACHRSLKDADVFLAELRSGDYCLTPNSSNASFHPCGVVVVAGREDCRLAGKNIAAGEDVLCDLFPSPLL